MKRNIETQMHPFTTGLLLIVVTSALLVSCSGDSPLATMEVPETGPLRKAGSVPDISGEWEWNGVVQLTMPLFVAQFIFGIPPEGPVTHVRCENSGEMTLIQIGAEFGTAPGDPAIQIATCETKGGLVFSPPPMAVAPFLEVVGSIRGKSLDFLFGTDFPCPFHGVISEVEGGVATHLKATGRCIVPGHPQSPVPMDPPPAGTSKTTSWEAVRP
jgi:hypothetical protein